MPLSVFSESHRQHDRTLDDLCSCSDPASTKTSPGVNIKAANKASDNHYHQNGRWQRSYTFKFQYHYSYTFLHNNCSIIINRTACEQLLRIRKHGCPITQSKLILQAGGKISNSFILMDAQFTSLLIDVYMLVGSVQLFSFTPAIRGQLQKNKNLDYRDTGADYNNVLVSGIKRNYFKP